jgi:hypothetical protein
VEPQPERVEARVEHRPVERPRQEAPKVDARELLSSTGLQMVETDRSKAAPVPVQQDEIKLGRPRRERPKSSADEGELLQVETRNK